MTMNINYLLINNKYMLLQVNLFHNLCFLLKISIVVYDKYILYICINKQRTIALYV